MEIKKKGLTIKQLRDLHLKDKHHIVTDDEINNLDMDAPIPGISTSHTPAIPDDKERPKDEDKDPEILIPWDLIQ
jgi:hypothetical protein